MRRLYTFFFYLALPFVFLRLYLRGRKAPAYKKRWAERLGYFNPAIAHGGIWLHAVSVGEVLAAVPLVKQLQKEYPQIPITMTCMTPTGSDQIKAHFGDRIHHVYTPYDVPFAIKSFLRKIKPKLFIIMETEIWPNILYYSQRYDIPVMLANARLSQRSYKRYARIRSFIMPILNHITLIVAQSEQDAKYFKALGIASQKVHISGNLKFDFSIPDDCISLGQQLRMEWGVDRPTWIAASTHQGEDEIIIAALQKLKEKIPDALLILVPRHPERFDDTYTLCRQQGYRVLRHSVGTSEEYDFDIYLGDTMGDLLTLYAASDIAFVGGSFVATGGHNLLEPAALKIPSITGPYIFNFTAIYNLLHEARACTMVTDTIELAEQLVDYFQQPKQRIAAGEQGHRVFKENQGALAKQISLIKTLYAHST